MPKQANEYLKEIVEHYHRNAGRMCFSWTLEHLAFLIKRWQWKTNNNDVRIVPFIEEHIPRVKFFFENKKFYIPMYRVQIEMILNALGIEISKTKEIPIDLSSPDIFLKEM